MAGRFPTTSEIRFSEKCRPSESGCIEWTGGTTPNGYGLFYADGQMRPAHRWIYEQTHGKLPPGIDCCHRCDVRLCVNLEHLFAGTRKQNMEDAVAKGRMSHSPRAWGEKHWSSTINEPTVLAMRDFAAGKTIADVAAEFSTTYMVAYRVVNRLTWRHI